MTKRVVFTVEADNEAEIVERLYRQAKKAFESGWDASACELGFAILASASNITLEDSPPHEVKALFAFNRRYRAHKYAEGLDPEQLLRKLESEGIEGPNGLAQAIGVSGLGSRVEIAQRIVTHMESCTCYELG